MYMKEGDRDRWSPGIQKTSGRRRMGRMDVFQGFFRFAAWWHTVCM